MYRFVFVIWRELISRKSGYMCTVYLIDYRTPVYRELFLQRPNMPFFARDSMQDMLLYSAIPVYGKSKTWSNTKTDVVIRLARPKETPPAFITRLIGLVGYRNMTIKWHYFTIKNLHCQ